jgi:hypothetical protein
VSLRWLFLLAAGFNLLTDTRAATSNAPAAKPLPKVVRGPYLQMATPQSVVLRWRTDIPTISQVRYGTNLNELKMRARAEGTLTEHVVLVHTNLQPDTKYYYSLYVYNLGGTNETLVSGPEYFFHTAPIPGANRPVRVWVLGDSGTKRPLQLAVRDAYFKWNGPRRTDLILMLGDNAYSAGKDDEYQKGLFDPYASLLRNTVLWPAIGNHDGGSANSETQSGIYYDWVTLPTRGQAGGVMSGTEAYYSFDYANIHFISLDSHDSDRSTNGPMYRWLQADLAANKADWTIAYWHHPPYTKGSHDSDTERGSDLRSRDMRQNFVPLLEAAGVDLVLCGHSHAYERSWFMDGHYGKSTNFTYALARSRGDGRPDGDGVYHKPTRGPAPHEGTVYVVAGSSGQISGVRAAHAAMLAALNMAGSLVLDVNGPRLDATFIDDRGLVRDYFTIVKGPHELAAAAAPAEIGSGPGDVPPRLQPLLAPSADVSDLSAVTNARLADASLLLRAYEEATNAAHKLRLAWALAYAGDAKAVPVLLGVVTNRVKDRTLTQEEEDFRLAMLPVLGFMAMRYEPPFALLKRGVEPGWWQTNRFWVSPRAHRAPILFAAACIQALGVSGRPEAIDVLNNVKKKGTQLRLKEHPDDVRDVAPDIEHALAQCDAFQKLGVREYPRRVLAGNRGPSLLD